MVDGKHTRGSTHLDDGIKRKFCRLDALRDRFLVCDPFQTVAIHDATNDIHLVAPQLRDDRRRVGGEVDERLFLEQVHVALGQPCKLRTLSTRHDLSIEPDTIWSSERIR